MRLYAALPDATQAEVLANGGTHNARIKLFCELFELDLVNDQNRLDFPAGHVEHLLPAAGRGLLEKPAAKFRVRQ